MCAVLSHGCVVLNYGCAVLNYGGVSVGLSGRQSTRCNWEREAIPAPVITLLVHLVSFSAGWTQLHVQSM